VTIEDAAELRLGLDNIVRMETRPPNVEGNGAVRQRQLLINSLRMRPDRIIIGEVRGEEAFDMLQAMNTGHEGSMTTIHANTPRDALTRLESMVSRMSDGTRKVVSISEITGMEENIVSMQDIFSFTRKGVGPDGKVIGVFQPSRIRPKFLERLRMCGIFLSPGLFEQTLEVN
jgi:pilus assembly protein CpaF